MQVLVINCGSSSVKARVLDSSTGQELLVADVERLPAPTGDSPSADAATKRAIQQAIEKATEGSQGLRIEAVGHRVVHGGEHFHDPVRIDENVRARIRECIPLAPLHNPRNLAGIEAAEQALPDLPHIAVFDTAFHARIPRRARTYAIDQDVAGKYGIRRYGFHGTSHAYVAGLAADHLGRARNELRMITLHLGNGASACAVEFGHSTETSMGMTPLEGLAMGTRSGDIDAGAVLAMLRGGMDIDEVEAELRTRSGLAGLSGTSGDLRDIETGAAAGEDRCRLAVNVFAHRVRKYLGAYAATMGGLDAVVLTGGIGENATAMRRRILQRFDFLGLVLDEDRNDSVWLTREEPVARISTESSRVAALAIRTDEALMIAREAAALVSAADQVENPGPVPVAISNRHLHLTKETFEALFGAGTTPTSYRGISQPGQFACEERVNLIGPRGRIDGVRLIGPLRSADQIEISRTDEFTLGVDAPIRDSGQTAGSAPITLEGPEGTVHLTEGLICARRHIHMTPEDGERFGVSNGDEVEVALTGGPRDLVFGDVLIRISPNYKLEMHLDTDEGNAAELSRGAEGELVFRDVPEASGQLRSRRLKD